MKRTVGLPTHLPSFVYSHPMSLQFCIGVLLPCRMQREREIESSWLWITRRLMFTTIATTYCRGVWHYFWHSFEWLRMSGWEYNITIYIINISIFALCCPAVLKNVKDIKWGGGLMDHQLEVRAVVGSFCFLVVVWFIMFFGWNIEPIGVKLFSVVPSSARRSPKTVRWTFG